MRTATFTSLWLQSVHAVLAPAEPRSTLVRRVTAVVAVALVAATLAIRVATGPAGESGGVGVELTLALVTATSFGCLLGCTSEFALASRPAFSSWLRTLPVHPRTAALLVRASVISTAMLLLASLALPLTVIVHRSAGYGLPHAVTVALAGLAMGLLIAPVLVLAAQRTVVVFRRGGFYGGAVMISWLVWASAGAAVTVAIFRDGAEAALGPHTWWIGWPAVLDLALFPSPLTALATGITLGAFGGLAWSAIGRLVTLDEISHFDSVRSERKFELNALVVLSSVRGWRNRRTRAYIVAGTAFAAVYVAYAAIRPEGASPETAAMIVALFLGGFSATKRGMSGTVPVEVRLLVPPERFAIALLTANVTLATAIGAVAGAALAVVSDRPVIVSTTVAVCVLGATAGTAMGSVLVPQPGDASVELMSTVLVMVTLAIVGNVSDRLFGQDAMGYVVSLLLTATLLAAVPLQRERSRWTRGTGSTRGVLR